MQRIIDRLEPQFVDAALGDRDFCDDLDTTVARINKSIVQLTSDQLLQLWDDPLADGESLDDLLLQTGVFDELQLAELYARQGLFPLFQPAADQPLPIDPAVARLVPAQLSQQHKIVPIGASPWTLEIAAASPESLQVSRELQELTGLKPQFCIATRTVIRQVQQWLYQQEQTPVDSQSPDFQGVPGDCHTDDENDCLTADEGKMTDPPDAVDGPRILRGVFAKAVRCHATQIRLEMRAGQWSVSLMLPTGAQPVHFADPVRPERLFAELCRLAKLPRETPTQWRQGSFCFRKSGGCKRHAVVNMIPVDWGKQLVVEL